MHQLWEEAELFDPLLPSLPAPCIWSCGKGKAIPTLRDKAGAAGFRAPPPPRISVSACAWQGAVCGLRRLSSGSCSACLFFLCRIIQVFVPTVGQNFSVPYARYVAGDAGQTQYLYLSELLQLGVPSTTQLS